MLGGGGESAADRPSSSIGQTIGDTASDDSEDAASGNGGVSNGNGGVVDEPTVAPEQPAGDPTAIPDEPAATPTATPEPEDDPDPEPEPCPFCPDIDDLQIEPTPVIFCPLCIDGDIIIDLSELEKVSASAKYCGDETELFLEVNRGAEMWFEYEKDGETHETDHQFGTTFMTEVDATWFPGWGWIYTVDNTFHAVDGDGNHITAWVNPHYC